MLVTIMNFYISLFQGNLSEATMMIKLALEKPLSHKEFLMFCDYEIGC